MDYFDQFSIFFWEDKLFTGKRWYPLGEITTELLNLDSKWFEKSQSTVDNFVPAAREMLAGKNEKATPSVQEKLNKVFDLLLEVPPYRDMDLDIRTSYRVFPMLVEDKIKREEATTSGTEGFKRIENFISTIENLSREMIRVLNQISAILALHFEDLTRRTKDAYSVAFTRY